MTSTFRLTRAEFKKIFKRPSVFIMAIMIVAIIFASLGLFNPMSLGDSTVVYDSLEDSASYYNHFMNADAEDSKIGFDSKFITSDASIQYYTLAQNRVVSISDDYQKIIQTMDKLRSTTDSSINDDYTAFKNAVNKFSTSLYDFSSFNSLKDYNTDLNNNPFYYHIDFLEKLYNEEASAGKSYDRFRIVYMSKSDELISSINYNETRNKRDIVTVYDTNEYEAALKEELDNAINYISTTLNYLKFKITGINQLLSTYDTLTAGNASDSAKFKGVNTDLNKTLEDLKTYTNKLIKNDELKLIFQNETDYNNFISNIEYASDLTSTENTTGATFQQYRDIDSQLQGFNISGKIKAGVESISEIKISKSTINALNKMKEKVNSNKEVILEKINELKTDEAIKNIQKSITDYKLLALTYHDYVKYNILADVTKDMDKTQFNKLTGPEYKEFNRYENNEKITLNQYYLDNNVYSNSYLKNFSFNQQSGNEPNVFDFVYFALELCTIIIIVFAMMLMCNIITAESESGTIKLLLVRPFRRSKIITAKLFATLFFVITFMLFSFILTFVGGIFVYGYTSTNVLAVFNATTAFEISPLALILLDLLFLTLDVIFFVIIALLIAILIKNYAGAISFSLVFLIVNYALNMLFGNSFWYSLLPGMNLHQFKFLGNSFMIETVNNLASILITGIESSMTFIFSALLYIAYSTIALVVSYTVFQHRDF